MTSEASRLADITSMTPSSATPESSRSTISHYAAGHALHLLFIAFDLLFSTVPRVCRRIARYVSTTTLLLFSYADMPSANIYIRQPAQKRIAGRYARCHAARMRGRAPYGCFDAGRCQIAPMPSAREYKQVASQQSSRATPPRMAEAACHARAARAAAWPMRGARLFVFALVAPPSPTIINATRPALLRTAYL